jgi:hypothetical protein
MIPHCTVYPFSALHVLTVLLTNLRYFVSQLYDALFDGILHGDRLAEEWESGSAGMFYDTEEKSGFNNFR